MILRAARFLYVPRFGIFDIVAAFLVTSFAARGQWGMVAGAFLAFLAFRVGFDLFTRSKPERLE